MPELSVVKEAVERLKRGELVVLVDDEDRENEGDLVALTDRVTPEALAFMMREARGLICVSIPAETAERLHLPLQVADNQSPFRTAFTISIDLAEHGITGVSAAARVATMRRMLSPSSRPEDFVSPGHVFPLIAHPRGVLGRTGQTEGSLDLARLAGAEPSGVICEVLAEDGAVAKGAELTRFAERHGLLVVSVAQVVRERIESDVFVRETARSALESDWGPVQVVVFEDDACQKEHLAVLIGDVSGDVPVLCRIHSECLTGDVIGSRRCDCRAQLTEAMNAIQRAGSGILLYLRQEGRGIGLENKLRAYALQDSGSDTVEANERLGFPADMRDFAVAARMLETLQIAAIRLMTNNPQKVATLSGYGICVIERLPLVIQADEWNSAYLETKRLKLGHLL